MLSPPPRYADRPIAALDQGRIYFTSFSPQDTTRFYVRTTIEFIREGVEFQSSSVPDPISRSIIHIYIYRFVFRNRILLSTKYSPIYLIFTFYSWIDDLKKIQRRRRIIIDHLLSCPRNWMKNWGISQRCVTLRYVVRYVIALHCETSERNISHLCISSPISYNTTQRYDRCKIKRKKNGGEKKKNERT